LFCHVTMVDQSGAGIDHLNSVSLSRIETPTYRYPYLIELVDFEIYSEYCLQFGFPDKILA